MNPCGSCVPPSEGVPWDCGNPDYNWKEAGEITSWDWTRPLGPLENGSGRLGVTTPVTKYCSKKKTCGTKCNNNGGTWVCPVTDQNDDGVSQNDLDPNTNGCGQLNS